MWLILELRSFQSRTGRINRNVVAQTVDTVCNTLVGSGAIVAGVGGCGCDEQRVEGILINL